MYLPELTDISLEIAYPFFTLFTRLNIINIIEMKDSKERL